MISTSASPSTSSRAADKPLMAERLARTVAEIDASPHNAFAVAVVLEVLGYTDQRAAEAGWADVFALARAVFERIEFLRSLDARRAEPASRPSQEPAGPSPLVAVVSQQIVWLVMVVLMIAWGRSIWSAERLAPSMAEALAVGVLGSLILSGGFQYPITRRISFYTSQRDLRQARAFLGRALWLGGACMLAGAAAAAAGLRLAHPGDAAAAGLAGAYFLLHGNYRLAVVPLVALNDVMGLVLSTSLGVAALAGAYAELTSAGVPAAVVVPASQLVALAVLWLASAVRSGEIIGGRPQAPDARSDAPRAAAVLRTRWPVVCRDAAPWFTTGVLYYLFLFTTRPMAWLLPPAERAVYEAGVDMGLIGIVPVAIAASWGLHRYHQALRGLLVSTSVICISELRRQAVKRFSRVLWQCRWFGIGVALALLALTAGAPWGTMNAGAFAVFRLTLVGLALLLPGFLFSFGLLASVGALWEGGGVLVCGFALQLLGGLAVIHLGTAGMLALVLVASSAALSELAGWRALRVVREIDRFYYAAF